MARMVSFGGGLQSAPAEYIDPQRISRQRAMADALTQQSQGRISGWGEGVANLARTAAAGFINSRANANEKTSNEARLQAMRGAIGSDDPLAALSQSNDPQLVEFGLQQQMAKLLKDPGETYATLTDAEERELGLDPSGTYQRGNVGNKVDVLTQPTKPTGPESSLAKLAADYKAGLIDKPTYDAMVKKETYIAYPQGPGPSDRAKRAAEAGLVPGTKEYNDFVLSSDQAAANPKQENILRDEFNALTKDFRTVQDAYSKIESTSQTGAGDMSMLYSYVKLLDPGSVVRESEFATAAASGSFGESVQGAVQRLATGERLPDSLRNAFKAEAKSIFAAQKSGYERLKTSYGNLATRTGVPTENVIVDYAAPEAVPPVTLGTQPPAGGAPFAAPDSQGGNIIRYDQQGKRIP
jgi:hypothetical protein